MLTTRFKVSPLQAVVLLYNVSTCKEASNDADRTVGEIIAEIDDSNGMLPKGLLESALYCCNMNSEDVKFWHPLGQNFDKFVKGLFEGKHHFDKYYNNIYEAKSGAKEKIKGSKTLGTNS